MGSGNREHMYDYGQWMLPGLTGGLVGKVEQWLVSACSSELLLPLCYVIKRVEGVAFGFLSFFLSAGSCKKEACLVDFSILSPSTWMAG